MRRDGTITWVHLKKVHIYESNVYENECDKDNNDNVFEDGDDDYFVPDWNFCNLVQGVTVRPLLCG